MADPTTIAQNLEHIRRRIAQAAGRAGRDPAAITLVAVSKTHPQAAVLQALAAGTHIFGENRVQEAAEKFPLPGAALHIIGPLQSNKVLDAVRLADCIETLDRDKILHSLDTAGQQAGRLPDLLVQINIGDEPQKSGIPRAAADSFIRAAKTRFGEKMRGLMCIPPAGQDPLPFFHLLTALADSHGLPLRSMGMSGDFEIAIEAGATHVRIGSAIFGSRPTPDSARFATPNR